MEKTRQRKHWKKWMVITKEWSSVHDSLSLYVVKPVTWFAQSYTTNHLRKNCKKNTIWSRTYTTAINYTCNFFWSNKQHCCSWSHLSDRQVQKIIVSFHAEIRVPNLPVTDGRRQVVVTRLVTTPDLEIRYYYKLKRQGCRVCTRNLSSSI